MEYAIDILLPIIGGLFLGNWLTERFGLSPIWTVILPILGMVCGIGMLYRRFAVTSQKTGRQTQSPPPMGTGAKDPDQIRLPVESLDFLYEKPPVENLKDEPEEKDFPDFDPPPDRGTRP